MLGGHIGVFTSVLLGYIKLNLLFTSVGSSIISPNDWIMQVCCGKYQGGHPIWIAKIVKSLFKNDEKTEIFSSNTIILRNDKKPDITISNIFNDKNSDTYQSDVDIYLYHIKHSTELMKPITEENMELIINIRKIYYKILIQFYSIDCPNNRRDELLSANYIKNELLDMLGCGYLIT